MKRVLLVATGDTIAYQLSAVASGAELLAACGPLSVRVTVEDVLAEPSWDTSPATMLSLARRARAALLDDGFDGVVVTHGADTLEETAFLTDLLADSARGGIVFTATAADLASSLNAAGDPVLRDAGAVVCFQGELHAARQVMLSEATTFSSDPVLGHVTDGRVRLTAPLPARLPLSIGEPETDVAVIKTYPGMTSALLDVVVDGGARGIVLEGTGAGSVPVELFSTISDLTGWDIPVVIASRTRTGNSTSLGADLAAKVGAISARGLSATHARSALMVALGAGGVDAVRKWFDDFQL